MCCCAETKVTGDIRPRLFSIWPGLAPVGDGTFEAHDVRITVHRPEHPNGAAVVICPGGGYVCRVADAEGHGIARWLNLHGITGVVLDYRLPHGNPRLPLLDAQRAIRTVRAMAGELGCDPGRVGIMGFSAGGHLAATAATHGDNGDAQSADPVDRLSSRPDFTILIYPVITMGAMGHAGSRQNLLGESPAAQDLEQYSNELQVTAQTPPAFLAHAQDDSVVPPEHSRMYFEALQARHVPATYLALPSGNHGLNGYRGPMWDAWQTGALLWLAAQGIISQEAP